MLVQYIAIDTQLKIVICGVAIIIIRLQVNDHYIRACLPIEVHG